LELSQRERTIKVKIVYYGPPVGGKTTNLQILHQYALGERRGELVSVNSGQDRTILFDLLPLKAAGFRGFDLKLQVLAVPGQAMYAATRRLVLKGADACVFVANSAADRWDENVQSFREMTENMLAHNLDPTTIPLVLQYNKRDLPQVTPVDFMDRALNVRKVDSIPAVAKRGEGVLETFSAILMRTMQDLASRYQILNVGKSQSIWQWTAATVEGMFGTASLGKEVEPAEIVETVPAPVAPHSDGFGGALERSAEPPRAAQEAARTPELLSRGFGSAERRAGLVASELRAVDKHSPPAPELRPAAPPRRTLRLDMPEDIKQLGSPEFRAAQSLADSYAETATRLTADLGEVREQRDLAQSRLADIQLMVSLAQDVLEGRSLDATLRTVLSPMADAASSRHGSFVVPKADGSLRPLLLQALASDPVVRFSGASPALVERLTAEKAPRLHLSSEVPDLEAALASSEPFFASLVSVPIRTSRGLQAMALLYFTPDDALPRPDAVSHLGAMAGALATALELALALEHSREAQPTQELAILGFASQRALEEILAAFLALRDRLSVLRRNRDAPPWFVEEFARLAPSLAGGLTTSRSLMALAVGRISREVVLVEDLVADLQASGVDVQVAGAMGEVAGDAVLLRMALQALVDHKRKRGAEQLRVTVQHAGGRTRFRVGAPALRARLDPLSSEAEDTGLHLPFVQRVVEAHGGQLSNEFEDNVNWTTMELAEPGPGGVE
jgi:signal recognition particle receptor subunit beta